MTMRVDKMGDDTHGITKVCPLNMQTKTVANTVIVNKVWTQTSILKN